MYPFFKRRDDLERRLRKERPQPREELVDRITEQTAGERSGRPRLIPRLQLAGGLSGAAIVVAVAFGGPGDLARTIGDLDEASHTAAHDQYREQVTICHRPPGNPDNARTIRVGGPAAERHIERHGDSVGPCPANGAATTSGGASGGSGGGESTLGTVTGVSLLSGQGGPQPVEDMTIYADQNRNGSLDRDDEGNPTEPFTESEGDGEWELEGLAQGERRIRGDDGNDMACVKPRPCVHELELEPGEVEEDLRFVYR